VLLESEGFDVQTSAKGEDKTDLNMAQGGLGFCLVTQPVGKALNLVPIDTEFHTPLGATQSIAQGRSIEHSSLS
jgi:hypothetical protein